MARKAAEGDPRAVIVKQDFRLARVYESMNLNNNDVFGRGEVDPVNVQQVLE